MDAVAVVHAAFVQEIDRPRAQRIVRAAGHAVLPLVVVLVPRQHFWRRCPRRPVRHARHGGTPLQRVHCCRRQCRSGWPCRPAARNRESRFFADRQRWCPALHWSRSSSRAGGTCTRPCLPHRARCGRVPPLAQQRRGKRSSKGRQHKCTAGQTHAAQTSALRNERCEPGSGPDEVRVGVHHRPAHVAGLEGVGADFRQRA